MTVARTNQLLSIVYDIISHLIAATHRFEVRGIFLDISKAFDRAWHKELIYKIRSTGILGATVFHQLQNYLLMIHLFSHFLFSSIFISIVHDIYFSILTQKDLFFNPDLSKQAQEVDHPAVTFNDSRVAQTPCQKHLGLYLDEKLRALRIKVYQELGLKSLKSRRWFRPYAISIKSKLWSTRLPFQVNPA